MKWIRLTALVAAWAVMILGCVRGLAAPIGAVEAQASPVGAGVGEGGDHFERGHGSMARHQRLPRQGAAAAGRPDVRGDVIRNEGRMRGRAPGGDVERSAVAGGADDRAVLGRDQNLGLATFPLTSPIRFVARGFSSFP